MQFQYHRKLTGDAVLTTFDIDSQVLQGNPLGDPTLRSQPMLLPPGEDWRGLPLVAMLSGYTGFNHKVVNKSSMWQPNVPERLAAAMASGEIKPAVFVWPACETKLGGSQYVNSIGTGNYQDYVIDEVIPAVEAEFNCGGDGQRVVVGKSSGGFGALSLTMRNPGFFRATASHAGDMGFDMSHFRGFADALTCWSKYGGIEKFIEQLPTLSRFGTTEHAGIEAIAMATCYSPNPNSALGFDLPVVPATGEINYEVFEKWLSHDPLRMVDEKLHAESLRQLDHLFLDAGETDEFALQWGLRRFHEKLKHHKIAAHVEYFKGGHFAMDGRWQESLKVIL
ncbi:MAG: S-formylglutathione hydrolase FrmB [Myxococcota bacterium]|jgi:S-formylglutathione hydrolase FrmB